MQLPLVRLEAKNFHCPRKKKIFPNKEFSRDQTVGCQSSWHFLKPHKITMIDHAQCVCLNILADQTQDWSCGGPGQRVVCLLPQLCSQVFICHWPTATSAGFSSVSWPLPGVKLRSNEDGLPNPPAAVEELDPTQEAEGTVVEGRWDSSWHL